MKKGVLSVLFVGFAIAAVASTSYWIGAEVENQFRAQSEKFQQQLAVQPGVIFEIDRYQRGYFSSIAETTFTFDFNIAAILPPAAQMSTEPFSFTLRHQISHGPWIDEAFSHETMSKIVTTLMPDDEQQELLHFYFSGQPAFSMTTWIEWAGGIKSAGRTPPYTGRDHTDQYDFQWGGLHFEFDGDWSTMQGKGSFNTPRFELSNAAHGMTVGGLMGNFSSFISPQGLALGGGEFSLDTFKVRREGIESHKKQFVMRDMKMEYDALQRGEVVDVMQQIGFRMLRINGEEFNNGTFRYELSNLDVLALQSIKKRYDQMIQSPLSASEQPQQVWLQEVQSLLPTILGQAPVLHISKAEVITIDGLISARLRLAIDNNGAIPASIELPAGLMALLPLIQVELDLKLPIVIIEQQARKVAQEKIVGQLQENEQMMAPEMLAQQARRAAEQMLVQFEIQNIIRREKEHFRAELHYSNGRLHLNGVPADNIINMLPPLKES